MKLPNLVTDFVAFIDGIGYAGSIKEATLPKIALVTEEHIAGGMGGTIEIFMGAVEKMELSMTIDGLSPEFLKTLGNPDTPLTLRGALKSGAVTETAIFQTRGLYKEIEFGNMARKDKGSQKLTAILTYFKATIGGVEIIEVDVLGKIFKVNGKDLMAEQRAALGA